MSVRIGTSGWSYPGPGDLERHLLSAPRPQGFRASDELSYYAEHFDTVEVNSTFYRQPSAHTTAGGSRRRRRASSSRSSSIRSSRTHPIGRGPSARWRRPTAGLRRPAAGAGRRGPVQARDRSDRRERQAGGGARAVPAGFHARPRIAGLSSPACSTRFATTRSPSNCVTARGATPARHDGAARTVPGRLGADRRAQVPALDPPGSGAEHRALLLHAPARAERRPVVVATKRRKSGTTTCTRARS